MSAISLELNLDLVGYIEIDSIAAPLFTNIRQQDPKNYADAETRTLVYIETQLNSFSYSTNQIFALQNS